MNTYKRHRSPPDSISYAVWLYYRFNLSHRDIEDLLAERGIIVTRESTDKLTQIRSKCGNHKPKSREITAQCGGQ
jgi:transposase-like protein